MIILDTSLIVSYKIENDQTHGKAVKIMNDISNGIYGKPVISDYIFDEVVSVIFFRSKSLQLAIDAGNEIMKNITMEKIDDGVFGMAWETFAGQKGTGFSFTDCTILALLRKGNIEKLATFDLDFEKAGVNIVKL